jgi:hypothetical protein
MQGSLAKIARHHAEPTASSRVHIILSANMRGLLTLVALLAPLAPPTTARAQTSPPARQVGDRLWGAWLGASFTSPAGDHWGVTPDRNLFLVGARAHYVLETIGPFALAFTADLIPAAVITNNPTYRRRVVAFDGQQSEYKEITDSGVVYGAGLSPVGLQLSVPMWRRMRAYAAGAVGALWFTREMPEPDARRFNYSFEFGGGFDVSVGTTRVVVVGFKFHHLSNLNTAAMNPGLDGHVFYLGLLRLRDR